MMRQIKNYAKKIWTEIENHLVKCIAGVIFVALMSMCYVFWEWLKSIHTLELLGIYWVLIFFTTLAIPILFWLVFQFFKKQFIHQECDSIKTVLKGHLRCLATSENDLNITIDYRNLDRKLHIEKGGTKRHIKTVLSEDEIWVIDSEGEDIILIGRNPAESYLLDND